MLVRRIDPLDPRDVTRFVRFPHALYRGAGGWTPPLRTRTSGGFSTRAGTPFTRTRRPRSSSPRTAGAWWGG